MHQRKIWQELRLQSVRETHDDRENHRRSADDSSSNQNRLRSCFERVSRAVVFLEQVLRALEVRRESEITLHLLDGSRRRLDRRQLEDRLRVVRDWTISVDRARD